MAVTTERLQYLLIQYANEVCTRQELLELLRAIEQGGYDEALQATMDSILADMRPHDVVPGIDREKIFSNIIGHTIAAPVYKRLWFKISAAAAIILLAGSVLLLEIRQPKQQLALALNTGFKNDVAPGGNKALLTLSDGKSISLTDAHKGPIAKLGNAVITKTADGQIVYNVSSVSVADRVEDMNLIKTPKGGKWDVTLSDGTKVWLNASSSIKYPSVFTGNERKVEITGEA